MEKICSWSECGEPVYGSGVCKKHYEYSMRGRPLGKPEYRLARKHKHKLSNIDAEAMTAECAECGPVEILRHGNGNSFECRIAKRKSQADYMFRRKYGITLAERDELWESQGRACAICLKEISLDEVAIDHCHTTGMVRGVLCGPCNRGLGLFYDSPEVLKRAVAYLEV